MLTATDKNAKPLELTFKVFFNSSFPRPIPNFTFFLNTEMNGLQEWCESIGLGKYHQQLHDEYEFESADIIAELDKEDLKQLTKDLRMSLNEKGKFLKALKQVSCLK